MLTDVALKNLKPKDKLHKVTDRDGMYEAAPFSWRVEGLGSGGFYGSGFLCSFVGHG